MNFRFGNSLPPVTKNLIIINIIFWVASAFIFPRVGIDLSRYLGLHFFQASEFNIAQLVTYMFMHDPHSIFHLFFNMFSLYMFGRMLEQVWGSKRFLIYYMVTGVGAGIIQEITWAYTLRDLLSISSDTLIVISENGATAAKAVALNNIITIGASGAVFGILLAFGMLFPNAPLMLMFIPYPIKAKYMVIGYGVLELLLGVGNFSGDNIAHFAHLGGMLFGFILIKYWKKKDFDNGKYFY